MKSVLFSMLAVFAMATPANAQGKAVSDFFGKYKFTATIEYTELGKSYEGQYKESSDVEIKKHEIYDGQIVGLAGRPNGQLINSWNEEKQTLNITNPSQGGVWGDLYMANEKGDYPFHGILPGHEDTYSTAYTYNSADGSFSLPDFTLGKGDYQAETFQVYVKFSNVKLTLVQLDKVDVADLTGDWHFKAPEGGYNTMEGSTIPVEFDFNLAAKDATKKAYTATLKLGDFAPVEIDASFNGSVFSLNLDSTCLDKAERIYIINTSSEDKKPYQEPVTFNYTAGGSLSMSSGMSIVRKDSIAPDKLKGYLQWYMAGIAKREGGDIAQFTWDGTYNMVAEEVYDVMEGAKYPKEFTMKVQNTDYGYFVTEFLGFVIPQGGFSLVPDEKDPKKAVIPAGYSGFRNLGTIEAGKTYYALGDQYATATGDIHLTLNDDNTVSLENFCVLVYDWATKQAEVSGSYVKVKGTKEAAPKFSWTQTFKVTADVKVYNEDYEFPTEFDMTVVANEYSGGLMLTHFLGNDISQLNYGGAGFTVAEGNPMEAAIAGGATMKSIEPGKLYLILADMNAQLNPVNVKADEAGNLTFDNFSVLLKNWETQTNSTVAFYTNVKATPVPTGIESVKKEIAKVWISNGAICMDKAQAVQVYDFSGKSVFSGVTSEVSGLAKGLYIVKTAAGVAKVFVR